MTGKKNNILVSPLDWGIGHAARCVPIINWLLENKYNVVVATSGRSQAFLKNAFPNLTYIDICSYGITYTKTSWAFFLKMLWLLPKIISAVFNEHRALKKIVKEHNIHLIISDNRYGLWHKNIPSVIISHQLMIKTPVYLSFLEKCIHKRLLSLISKHDECWIPDFKDGFNLAGDLSHKYPVLNNTFFIGPLSRFKYKKEDIKEKIYDVLFLISGPEPQRSIFEKAALLKSKNSHLKIAVLRGMPDKNFEAYVDGNVNIYAHLPTDELQNLILNSKIVIARSGYSTIMDLWTLDAKALLIPTPGQTEQGYLATYLSEKKLFLAATQDEFLSMDNLNIDGSSLLEKVENIDSDSLLSKNLYRLTCKHLS